MRNSAIATMNEGIVRSFLRNPLRAAHTPWPRSPEVPQRPPRVEEVVYAHDRVTLHGSVPVSGNQSEDTSKIGFQIEGMIVFSMALLDGSHSDFASSPQHLGSEARACTHKRTGRRQTSARDSTR